MASSTGVLPQAKSWRKAEFISAAQVKFQGAPARRSRVGKAINAWTMEQSKKLWGELNHRRY